MEWEKLQLANPVTDSIYTEWTELLCQEVNEHFYHDFIKKHASMFFVDSIDTYFSISKLKLGSDLETDFAVPIDNRSLGLSWNLVELKTPKSVPYNKNGTPSATLTKAVQQVMDWKQWLKTNRTIAGKMFQSRGVRVVNDPNFTFTIIIGSRENSLKYLGKRNDYAKSLNIKIRSFDYLTEQLRRKTFHNYVRLYDGNWDEKHLPERKLLANPFFEALNDTQWKKILLEPGVTFPHFTSTSCEVLLRFLETNNKRLEEFKSWLP